MAAEMLMRSRSLADGTSEVRGCHLIVGPDIGSSPSALQPSRKPVGSRVAVSELTADGTATTSEDYKTASGTATMPGPASSSLPVVENGTGVAALTATDADTATKDFSWSIPTGVAGGSDGEECVLTANNYFRSGA